MGRLIVTLALAIFVGIAAGFGQYYLNYSGVSENMAEFRAITTQVANEGTSSKLPAVAEAGVPKVEVVGGAGHNFGTMQQGATKSHAFRFRNIGTAPLTLVVAGSSCRCTIGTLADSSLEPGEETDVKLEWVARGVLDEFGQTATIVTNDPVHERVLLSVNGRVLRTIMMEPQSISLGDFSATSDYKTSIHVFSNADDPLEILGVKWGDEKTAAKVKLTRSEKPIDLSAFPEHSKATGAARIDVEIGTGLPIGPLDTRIVIETNVKTVPSIEFSVSGNIVGDVQVMGSSSYEPKTNILTLGNVNRKIGLTSRLFLSVQGPQRKDIKVELDKVVPEGTLNVTIDEPKEQVNRILYPVTITVPENAPPAMYPGTSPSNFGKIYFKTSHPDMPTVPVHVRLIVE